MTHDAKVAVQNNKGSVGKRILEGIKTSYKRRIEQ
jgi:hypothetical protein